MSETRDELAARLFPEAWAKVANVQGKRAGKARHNLRRRAEDAAARQVLWDQGARCGNCRSFSKYPHGPGMICEANSDFHGYMMAKADGLCTDWRAKAKGPQQP